MVVAVVAEMTTTQWAMLGIGGALVVFGVVALILGTRSRGKLRAVSGTSTMSVAQAAAAAGTLAGSQVEIKGTAEGQPPLTSPATNTPCLYFKHKVEGLNVRMERDVDGTMQQHQDWDVVYEEERSTPFVLRDSSGSIWVMPEGAEFVPERTLKNAQGALGYSIPQQTVGQKVLDTVATVLTSQYDFYSRYRTSEWVIPVGRPLYVLGSVQRDGEQARVAAGGGKFIISAKSEEELSRKYRLSSALWTVSGILSLAGGAVLAALGALKK